MGEVKEEDIGLHSSTWSSPTAHGGPLHPQKAPTHDEGPTPWGVVGAALAVGAAAVTIALKAPVLYRAARNWWDRFA